MSVTITGKRIDGTEFSKKYSVEGYSMCLNNNQLSSIDLSSIARCTMLIVLELNNNQLSSIDLRPLAKCKGLSKLILSNNQLSSIDLRPLAKCTKLDRLDLSNNKLSSIDLRPLENCSDLEKLNLSRNKLSSIDLSHLRRPSRIFVRLGILNLSKNKLSTVDLNPLVNCRNLDRLDLSNNQLSSIDLRPLAKCTKLDDLFLDNNKFKKIDLTPIIVCSALQEFTLDDNVLIEFFSEILPEKWKLPEALKIYYKKLKNKQKKYALKKLEEKKAKEIEKDSCVFFKLLEKYQRVPTTFELFQEGIPSERVNEVVPYINRLENFNISDFNLDEIIELDDKIRILTKIVKNPFALELPLISNELDIGAFQAKKIMALLEHTLNSTKLHKNHIKQAKLQLSDWADQSICHYLCAKNKVKEKDFITNLWKMSVNSEIGPWSIRF